MIRILISIAIMFNIFIPTVISSEEIPDEVFKAAERGFDVYLKTCNNPESFKTICSDVTVNIEELYLNKQPLEVLSIDYNTILECSNNGDLFSKAQFAYYFFFVCNNDNAIGTIGVCKLVKFDKWEYCLISRGGAEAYRIVKILKNEFPEADGNRLNYIIVGNMGEWIIMVSDLINDKYWITSPQNSFLINYSIPKFKNKYDLIPIENILNKFKEKAKSKENMEQGIYK